ncbi:MAG: GAF domain-containing protein [Anaerolineae bacterium]|nr:GAF domain-containing protein [Anaerolineae bacterium]
MSTPLAFSLIFNLLALAFTLSVLLLSFLWRNWRTGTGRALLQFLFSLALLQSSTLITHTGLLADFSEGLVKIFVNLASLSFFLVSLASLMLILQAANALQAAWDLICRMGIAGLVILQPGVWQHGVINLPAQLDETLFGSPYTNLGQALAVLSVMYIGLTLFAGWYYWRRIDAPLLVLPLLLISVVQLTSLTFSDVREYTLTGVLGGIISGVLGFYLILRLELTPQSPQLHWLKAITNTAIGPTQSLPLRDTLTNIAEQLRRLLRTDSVAILLAIGPDRLEVVTVAGQVAVAVGRQISVGEGLSGRVMQTLQTMRVDDYQSWNGRAIYFADLPYCASISVPLIHEGKLIGVINVHEIAPGRRFDDQDQAILEMLAPQVTLYLAQARLQHNLHVTQTYFKTVMEQHDAAMLIFDAAGILREVNTHAQTYLQTMFGPDATVPTAIELAGHAQDVGLTEALVQWAIDPTQPYTVQTSYAELGILTIQLQAIPNTNGKVSDLLMIIMPHAAEH